MVSSFRFLARNTVAGIGLVLLTWVGYQGVMNLSRVDAFARYRPKHDGATEKLGVQMTGVRFRHYHGGEMKLAASVDTIEVMKDRVTYQLTGVKDGTFTNRQGQKFSFSAGSGNYQSMREQLQISKGAQIAGADFDLRASELTVANDRQMVMVDVPLRGHLKSGNVEAKTLTYSLYSGDFDAEGIHYAGKIDLLSEDGKGENQGFWDVKGEHGKSRGGIQYFDNGWASDGETIITAPKIERNTKTDVLTATGGVKYFSKKANMIADKVVVYRKEKRSVLTGNVFMLVKAKKDEDKKLEVVELKPFQPEVPDNIASKRPKASGQLSDDEQKKQDDLRSADSLRSYPLQITASQIVYWYKKGERHAEITGNPQAYQVCADDAWRRMWTFKAFYDGEKETLRMESKKGEDPKKPVDPKTFETRMKNSVGDDLRFEWMTVSTKEDDDVTDFESGIYVGKLSDPDNSNREEKSGANSGTSNGSLKGPIGGGTDPGKGKGPKLRRK